MTKIIVIGNRFMRDDGIAIEVIDRLKDKFNDDALEIIVGETDCSGCFYLLDESDFVIILDAINVGAEPGSVFVFSLSDLMTRTTAFSMQHDMSIIDLMKLYDRKFNGYLIGIEIAEIDFDEKLSLVLQEKLPLICSKVEKTIKSMIMEEFELA